jgi:hypothetical protein
MGSQQISKFLLIGRSLPKLFLSRPNNSTQNLDPENVKENMNLYIGVSAPKFLLTGTIIQHDSYIIAVVTILAYNCNSCTCMCVVVLFSAAVQQQFIKLQKTLLILTMSNSRFSLTCKGFRPLSFSSWV